jgi:hypothetical protein
MDPQMRSAVGVLQPPGIFSHALARSSRRNEFVRQNSQPNVLQPPP